MGVVYPDGTFIDMHQIREGQELTVLELMTYFQLRAALRAYHPSFPEAPATFQVLKKFLKNPSPRKLITRL